MAGEVLALVEFLTTTRLGEKGQLTVPKEYREALRLETGAPMAVLRLGSGLLLIPEQARFRQLCERIAGVFAGHGVTEANVLSSLPAARRRVFGRRYPGLSGTEKKQPAKKKKKKAT
jgi:AbrB family looped-hinge helix DNA binding protein